jgi:hypothetical protein
MVFYYYPPIADIKSVKDFVSIPFPSEESWLDPNPGFDLGPIDASRF